MWSKALNSRSSTEARHEENRETAEDNRLEVIQIEMLKKRKRFWGESRSGGRTEKGRVYVKQGKGDKDQVVWLNEEVLEVLREWKAMKPESEYLFTTLQDNPINPRYVREMVKRKGKQAGINKDLHPHMLRRSFATGLYREGKNLRLVQKALGHSSIQVTEIYTAYSR